MSRFENLTTGAVFSVDDSKDHRYAGEGYKRVGDSPAPAVTESDESGTSTVPTSTEPPRAGAGSGRNAWADHAGTLGIDVVEDMTRDDIIEAVDAHNAGSTEP